MSLTKIKEKIINRAREVVFAGIESLLSLQPRGAASPRRVLVVRLDAIGDFILWLDAAKALRELYPRETWTITLLGNSAWTPLAETLPYFDHVLSLDRRSFFKSLPYRLRMLKGIRKGGYDIAISPAYSREFHFADAVVRASAAAKTVGFTGDLSNITSWQRRVSDRWYTKLVPASGGQLMELERNAEFMRGLGLPKFRAGVPSLPVSGALPDGFDLADYFVLFPGASVAARQWPQQRFAELADRIHQKTGRIGVICGGPGEEQLGDAIAKTAKAPVVNWSGRTTLQQLAEVIARAGLLVSNDTSAVHIAAAVSTPVVCILGGGHYGRFLPYKVEQECERPLPVAVAHKKECFGCNWECVYEVPANAPVPCVESVSTDDVWSHVEPLLDLQLRGPR